MLRDSLGIDAPKLDASRRIKAFDVYDLRAALLVIFDDIDLMVTQIEKE
jgi:hypothetical protein